jgi:AhpD family alkylhydroperoxidase
MQSRMKNPAMILPDALKAIQALNEVTAKADVSQKTLALVHLRASQINGCSFCVDMGGKHAKKAGESEERLLGVSAWREMPYFTDAERAALALTEAVTRIADRSDPVPDDIWNAAVSHFSESALAAMLLHIGLTNLYNRFNVAVRQPAGEWKPEK